MTKVLPKMQEDFHLSVLKLHSFSPHDEISVPRRHPDFQACGACRMEFRLDPREAAPHTE